MMNWLIKRGASRIHANPSARLRDYQACVKRIQGDDSGHKHCTGQFFDYWFCEDKCVVPKLITKLK